MVSGKSCLSGCSAANIQLGKVFFNFDFTPVYPAEHVTFRSHLVNDYIEEVFN